ncbi:MAG: methyltransferase domain-containing protein [Chloroflexi bacterium]|nr:methyltransferase domain-containing protein [Chloroflexota bacterium]
MTEDRGSLAAQQQFGRQAAYYVRSRAHATGDSLQGVVALAQPASTERALDVATGTGFTAFAVAPHAAYVVAYDLTQEMLREAIALGQRREIANVRYVQGMAEGLPFPDDTFDLFTCRTAPHHFASVPQFLAEARRVLRPGGRLVVADTVTTEDSEVDRWQNRVELLRDPSHVRDYAPSEWLRFLAGAGLTVTETVHSYRTHLSFFDWVERSGTPPEAVVELRRLFLSAPPSVVRALQVRAEGEEFHFAWPVLLARAVKQ